MVGAVGPPAVPGSPGAGAPDGPGAARGRSSRAVRSDLWPV